MGFSNELILCYIEMNYLVLQYLLHIQIIREHIQYNKENFK